MIKTILLILICSPLASEVSGQAVSDFRAWLEKESFEETTLIRGFCENKKSTIQRLTYRFTTKIGGQTEVKDNKFLIQSGKIQALSKAVVFFNAGMFDLVKIEIFQNEILVAADSITAETLENIASKTTVPEPEKPIDESNNLSDLEIDGLIIDETRSKLAHDFYEYFYNKWTAPLNANGYLITIKELPSRGFASHIAIEINGETLIEQPLEPRDEIIEQTAAQLVEAIQKHLERQTNLNEELDNEDATGTGIF